MALRRREVQRQQDLWISTSEIARSPGHVFYQRLSELLHEANFDRFVEDSVAEFYASDGRPGVAPGVYFRMLFIATSKRSTLSEASRGDVRTACRCGSFWELS